MTRISNIIQINNFEVSVAVIDPATAEELATLLLEAATFRRTQLQEEQEAKTRAQSKG